MSKFAIDLNNYPNLKTLFTNDKQEFARILKAMLLHIDSAIAAKHLKTTEEVYKMDYIEMMFTLMETFLNYEGIVQQHGNPSEKEALSGLKHDIHPLSIFTNNTTVYDVQGNLVSPYEHIQQDRFNLKNWLYALFYGARFVSWKELAEYLNLGKYELIDVLKARNIQQLLPIQPALKYQDENDIPQGKILEGYGLFDCGTTSEENCPACSSSLHTHENIKYCKECRAGFNNENN